MNEKTFSFFGIELLVGDPDYVNPKLNLSGKNSDPESSNMSCYLTGICCPFGWSGRNCSIFDICASNPCKIEGACIPINQTYFECQCGNKFQNSRCQSKALFPAKLLLNLIGDKVAAVFTNKTLKIWQPNLKRSSTYDSINEISSMTQLNDSNLFISECNKTSQHNYFRLFNSTQLTSTLIQFKTNGCVTALKSFIFNTVEFIAIGNGNQVQLLNNVSSTQLMIHRNLSYHNELITCLDYNSDSSLLASGSADSSIGIWNMASYKTKYTTTNHTDQVNVISLLSNGSLLATGSRDTTIKIWNKTNLNLIATLDAEITTYAIVSLGNGMFASAGSSPDGHSYVITIWNETYPFDKITQFQAHNDEINALQKYTIKSELRLISGSKDLSIRIWNATTVDFILIKEIRDAHSQTIYCLVMLPDGNFASGSMDTYIKIWDASDFHSVYDLKDASAIFKLAVLNDGNLVSATEGYVSFWNLTSFQLMSQKNAHKTSVLGLLVLENGFVLSGSNDQFIRVWNPDGFKLVNTLVSVVSNSSGTSNSGVKDMVIVLNENEEFVSIHDDYSIRLWEPTTNLEPTFLVNSRMYHLDQVLVVTFLKNTNYLASGSQDKTIIIWDLIAMSLFKTLNGHSNDVTCLTNLPDTRFASGSLDKTIIIWNILNWQKEFNLTSHLGGINSLTFVKNSYLLSASKDTTIVKWNYKNELKKLINQENAHNKKSVQQVTLISNDELASAGDDFTIRIWKINFEKQNLIPFQTLSSHNDYVYSIVSFNNNLTLASSSKDLTIRIWFRIKKSTEFKPIQTLYGHTKSVISLFFTSNYLISGSCDTSIKLWNENSFSLVTTLEGHKGCVNTFAQFNKFLLSGSNDKTIIIWDIMNNFRLKQILTGHQSGINSLDVYQNNLLASASDDSSVMLWNFGYTFANSTVAAEGDIYAFTLIQVNVTTQYLVSGSTDQSINVFYLLDQQLKKIYEIENAHKSVVKALATLSNNRFLSASYDNTIKVWNSLTFEQIKLIDPSNSDSINSLAVLQNGNFVSGGNDFNIRIWDSKTYDEIKIKGTTQVYSIVTMQNGSIAYGVREGNIHFLDPIKLDEQYRIMYAHQQVIWALTLLANGDLVSGSADKLIKIWNKTTFSLVETLFGHTEEVWCLIATSENLFSGGLDKTIRVWDPNTYQLKKILIGHTEGIEALIILSNNVLASGSDDNTIKIWTFSNDIVNVQNLTHSTSVQAIKFLDNGLLSSGSLDGSIKLWRSNQSAYSVINETAPTNTFRSLVGVNSLSLLSKDLLASSSTDGSIKIWNTNVFLNTSTLS